MEERIVAKEEPLGLKTVFGVNDAAARVLDFLILSREWDYSVTAIAKEAQVGRRSAIRVLHEKPGLLKLGIVKPTRKVGPCTLYKLNLENPIAQALAKLKQEIVFQEASKLTK